MILIEPAIEKKFGRAALKKRALGEFLSRATEAAKLAGRVSVMLTGDEEIRQLNRVFRRKDKATDVLSFPALKMNGNRKLAGDLAISVETAAREAEQREHALHVELKILILHGVLHLAGWDHETDSGEMARKEESLRKRLALEEGLIGRAQKSATREQGSGNRAQSSTVRKKRSHPRPSRRVTGGSEPSRKTHDRRSSSRALKPKTTGKSQRSIER